MEIITGVERRRHWRTEDRLRIVSLPVVLATGHLGALEERTLPPGVGVLRKPLEQRAIAAALRRALAGAGEEAVAA